MKLVIGLGNPGKKYEKTRHNIGFMVADRLCDHIASTRLSEPTWELSKKFNAEIAGAAIHGEQVILVKPMTFMNDSGIAVQLLTHFYKLTHRDIIVVHDDKDLPLGEIRMESNRGSAGHNGVKSIITHLGTQDFARVRMGIAVEKKLEHTDTADFVLGKFSLLERKKVSSMIDTAVDQLMTILTAHR